MKALYRDLDLESVYYKYEEETHKQIKELIAKVEHIPHEVRYNCLEQDLLGMLMLLRGGDTASFWRVVIRGLSLSISRATTAI